MLMVVTLRRVFLLMSVANNSSSLLPPPRVPAATRSKRNSTTTSTNARLQPLAQPQRQKLRSSNGASSDVTSSPEALVKRPRIEKLSLDNSSKNEDKPEEWNIKASHMALQTCNPIRRIVDSMKLTPNPTKPMIALSIGDPSVFGNLPPPEAALAAVERALRSTKVHGYAPSVGTEAARAAVATYSQVAGHTTTAKDVILCSGASSALDLCISVLCNAGDNLLVPRPGFSLYQTLAESLGVEVRYYDLLPAHNWEADLTQLTQLVDARTAGLVINNPSNPCGSVYGVEHLRQLMALAERHRLPVIADEIYAHFVFAGQTFHPCAGLSTRVPVLSCAGLTKRWLVPGWRMGWIVMYDAAGHLQAGGVRQGLLDLSTRILGPNSVVQAALPDILADTPASFFQATLDVVEANATAAFTALKSVPGLNPIMPQGAMYMMVGVDMAHFPDLGTDLKFTERMVTEQSVFCLPAKCFQYPNYFRIVLTVPLEQIQEACMRICEFCAAHYKP